MTEPLTGLVYLLCAATSLLCAILLLRGYQQTRVRLLLWSGLCFLGLMVENSLLYVDVVVVPDINMAVWRKVPGLLSTMLLVFGLVWESK